MFPWWGVCSVRTTTESCLGGRGVCAPYWTRFTVSITDQYSYGVPVVEDARQYYILTIYLQVGIQVKPHTRAGSHLY